MNTMKMNAGMSVSLCSFENPHMVGVSLRIFSDLRSASVTASQR